MLEPPVGWWSTYFNRKNSYVKAFPTAQNLIFTLDIFWTTIYYGDMAKLKTFHITDPIYNTDLVVCKGDYQKYIKFCKKNYNVDVSAKISAGRFYAFVDDNTGKESLSIWLPEYDIGTLLHECLHCAVYVLNERGIKIATKMDEPFCYYTEWLFRSIKGKIVK